MPATSHPAKALARAPKLSPTDGKAVEYRLLADLDFDTENPRFGRAARDQRTQTEILDYIVRDFGIDDVLSSVAVNGYFVAEPLIGRQQDKGNRLTIVEGNRRLAACLILANDPRAKNQARKVEQYQSLQLDSERPPFNSVPVICFGRHEREKDLLSYLGVRHIAASQGWDSYAKAAWIAKAVEAGDLSLHEIALMTGDQHRTVRRLLEGYYFINQMQDEGLFDPSTSLRRGRGSNPEFPFSWIYTLLGYQPARQFLKLPNEPRQRPIPATAVGNATLVVKAMFGDKNAGRSAAIEDSRELGELASALASPEKVVLLNKGKSLADIEFETQPIEQKLRNALADCKAVLGDLVSAIEANPPDTSTAGDAYALARQVQNLATSVARRLGAIQAGEEL